MHGVDGVWGWTLGLGHALACLLALVIFVRRRREHAAAYERARALESGAPVLRPGEIVTVRGTVVGDGRPAIEVRIEQVGREYRVKYGYRHTWKEVGRSQVVRPFALRLDDGTELECVVPEDVVFADLLGTEEARGIHRERVARLVGGDSVALSGRLEQVARAGAGDGYRDGAVGLRLVAPPRALVSAEHLAESGARWSTFYGRWALGALLVLSLVQSLAWIRFYDVAWAGEPCTARVSDLSTYETQGRHGRTTHHVLQGVLLDGPAEGEALREEIDGSAWRALDLGDEIVWRVVPGRSAHHQPGSALQVSWMDLVILVAASLALAFGFYHHLSRTKRWWEHERLNEDFAGRLP